MVARLRIQRGDEGFTLVELLVTMILMGLVGTLVLTTYTTSTRVVIDNDRRLDSVNIALIGMERVSKAVRAGTEIKQSSTSVNIPAFRSTGAFSLSLHSYLGTRPQVMTYAINSQRELTETVVAADSWATEPYWTFSGAGVTRVVARKIPAGVATPLFRYYDGAGVEVAPTTDQNELRRIEQVAITLTVQADPDNRVRPAVLRNRVALPNLGFARRR